jgi:hypothetical protein
MKMVDVNEPVRTKKNSLSDKLESPIENTQQKVAENKDNFWEITDLPSKFKVYPNGTKLYGRPLKVLEVKKLATIDENNVNSIINDILAKTIKGINIRDLLLADKLFLVFWLRANTYKDSSYSVAFKCPRCKVDSAYSFSLDSISIKYIKDDYENSRKYTLPISKNEITTKYLTVGNEDMGEEFKNKYKEVLEINDEVLGVALSIAKIDSKEFTLYDNYMYLINMNPGDYSYLETNILKNDVGIDPIMTVKCNKCGGNSPVGVTFREDFFVPDYIS